MTKESIRTYKADETPNPQGHIPLPYAAYDKTGRTWRITADEAEQINAAAGAKQ